MTTVNINQIVMDIQAHTEGAHAALDNLNEHIIETASGGNKKVTNAALAGMVELAKEVIKETSQLDTAVATALKSMLENYDKYATQRASAATKQAILEQRLAQETAKTSIAEGKEVEESARQVSRTKIQLIREEAAERREAEREAKQLAKENAASAAQAIRLRNDGIGSISQRRESTGPVGEGEFLIQDIHNQFAMQQQLNEAIAAGTRLREQAHQVGLDRDIRAATAATQALIFEDQREISLELEENRLIEQRALLLRQAQNAAYVVMQNNGLPRLIGEEQEYNHELAQELRYQQEIAQAEIDRMRNGTSGGGPPGGGPPNRPPVGGGGQDPFGQNLNNFANFAGGGGLAAGGALIGGLIDPAGGQLIGGAIGSLLGSLMGQVQNFMGLLGSVAGTVTNLLGQGLKLAIEGLTAPFRFLGDLVGNVTKSFGDFFGGIVSGALQLGLAYIGVQTLERALKTLLETTIGFNADLELSHNAWTLLLKDMRDGTDRSSDLQMAVQQNAIATSFGFATVDRTVRQLLQGGINVGEIFSGLLDTVEDVAASMGPNMLHAADRLALALGQIKEAGHLTGEEMRQLRNAGVNIPEVFATISKQTGITTAELQKMQRAGTLTSDMFFKGFKEWGATNFGGLAKTQAASFTGAMEQIQEAVTVVSSRAVVPAFNLMSKTIQGWANVITSPEVMLWAARFAGGVEAVIDAVQTLATGFRVGLDSVISIVQSAGQLVYNALQWFNPLAHHSPSLVESVEDGVQRILDAYNQLGRGVPASLEPAANAMVAFRHLTELGLEKLDASAFEHLAKDLSAISPAAPQAYRDVQLAIRGLKEDAAALSPEIIAETENVRQLKNELAAQNGVLTEWEDKLKLAKDALLPLNEEIKAHQIAIQLLNVDIARATHEYAEFLNTLQPLKDAVTAAEDRVKAATVALDAQQIVLRQGEMSLVAYKEAVTNAQDGLSELQEHLSRTRDRLSDVNDQLSQAKAGLKDVLATPLEGTAKFATQISDAETKIAAIQLRIANARAAGAKDDSLKGMNAQLAIARAHLDAIQARKKVQIDIPEAELKALAAGHTEEISIGMKREGIEAAQAVITPLEAAAKNLDEQARSQRDLVRTAQEHLGDLKETLHVQDQVLNVQRNRVKEAENVKQQAELERDAAKATLETALLAGKPIQDKIILLTQERDRRQEALNIVEAEKKTIELIDIQPIIDQVEEEKRKRDDINRLLSDAKGHLSDLQAAQAALVNLAKSWQSEIDSASQKAKQFAADARKDAREPQVGENDSPRETGADSVLVRFANMRKDMADEQGKSRIAFKLWLTNLENDVNAAVPWLGGFFGRVTGFLQGVASAMTAAANNDFPLAKQVLWNALKNVAQDLPAQLVTWQWAFLNWAHETGVKLVTNVGTFIDNMIKLITGQGKGTADGNAASDLEGGMSLWRDLFLQWIPPMGVQLLADIQLIGDGLNDWVVNQLPVYEASLAGWTKTFWEWVEPIWKPMVGAFETMIVKPLKLWVEEKAPLLRDWILTNWVGPFVDWVFKGDNSVWEKLKPEITSFIKGIFTFTQGDGGEEDPLHRTGMGIARQIKDGFIDVALTIAGEMSKAMIDAIVKWHLEHKEYIVAEMLGPLAVALVAVFEQVAPMAADAFMKKYAKELGNAAKWKDALLGEELPMGPTPPGFGKPPAPPAPGRPPGPIVEDVPFVVPAVQQGQQNSMDILQQAIDGLIDPEAYRTAAQINGDAYEEGLKDTWEIMSPSKVFQRIGGQAAEGLNLGLQGGVGMFKQTAGQYAAAFKDGGYFSQAEGQMVRGGFSLNGARKIEEEPWFIKHKELFPDAPMGKPLADAAAAEWNSNTMPAKGPGDGDVRFIYPEKDKPPMPYQETGDRGPRSFSYDTPGAGDPTNVTLQVVNNGILVGNDGMKQFSQMNLQLMAREFRMRRLF